MRRRPFAGAGRSVNSIVKFQRSPFNDRVLVTSNTAPQRIPLSPPDLPVSLSFYIQIVENRRLA